MTLERWVELGWLREHTTSREEIRNCLKLVERDLQTADEVGTTDWKFNITYNAALSLCSLLLRSAGYRTGQGESNHYRTIQCLEFTMEGRRRSDVAYLDACRKKRNTVEYDMVGVTTKEDVAEILEFTREFRDDVVSWLRKEHPELV